MVPSTIEGATANADDFRALQQLVARVIAGKEPGFAGAPRARRDGMTKIARVPV
jgi:hypothetical protein